MAATLLDGNAFLEHVKADLRARVKVLGERGITPGLGTILVGDGSEQRGVHPRQARRLGRRRDRLLPCRALRDRDPS